MQPSITHDLFDQTNGIGRVGFVEEHDGVHILFLISLGLLFSLSNEFCDINLSCTAMNLPNPMNQSTI
jgi:hypothetical protein